jgi:hypothetical protein
MYPTVKPRNKPKPSKTKFFICFALVLAAALIIILGVVYGYVEPRKRRIKECQHRLFDTSLDCRYKCNNEENTCRKNCDEGDYDCRRICTNSNEKCKSECDSALLIQAAKCDSM